MRRSSFPLFSSKSNLRFPKTEQSEGRISLGLQAAFHLELQRPCVWPTSTQAKISEIPYSDFGSHQNISQPLYCEFFASMHRLQMLKTIKVLQLFDFQ